MNNMYDAVLAVSVFRHNDRVFAATSAALKHPLSPVVVGERASSNDWNIFPLHVAIKQLSRRWVSELPLTDAAME